MPYIDPDLVHVPTTGAVAPAAWGNVVRDNFEHFADPPACQTFNLAVQTIPDQTLTVVNAPNEGFDNDAMHSTVTNNSRITAQTPGRYLLFTTVRFQASTLGTVRLIQFLVNGSSVLALQQAARVDSTTRQTDLSGARWVVMDPGGFVEVRVLHDRGSDIDVRLQEFAAAWFTR